MAIFGTFDEISPPEALTAAGRGTGVFIAHVPPAHHYEIFLRAGSITGFREDGVLLDDIMRLHDRFTDLLLMRVGDFEFRRLPSVRVEGPFHVPLEQMVVTGMACAEELNLAPELLPSSETVFEWVEHNDVWLGDELQLFWERSEHALRNGASAEVLAEMANTSTSKAQWYLYKLRLAGLVRPRRLQRAVAPAAGGAKPTADFSLLAPIPALAQAPDLAPKPLAAVHLAAPERPFLRRLMDGLASLLR